MTIEIDEVTLKLMRIFQPETLGRREAAMAAGTRFVHYTSASAATSILRGPHVWLRNATTMNDVSEINFGNSRLIAGLGRKSEQVAAKKFWVLLGELNSELPDKIVALYDGWVDHLRMDTYLFCLSEHDDAEDEIGRLSMWRAYGGAAAIAIVINPAPMYSYTDALSAYAYPVIYCAPDDQSSFQLLVSRMEAELEFLKTQSAETLVDHLFECLQSQAICSKHLGFKEEREWRIVHQPKHQPNERLKSSLVDVRGIPQIIYELPLRDFPEENLVGLNLNHLISRIIIGPTAFPLAMYDYFVRLLEELKIDKAHERVFLSNIPLRT
ncbi:MAG: DUF2971 domain-containing protein [Hyphomicrobiaceae bacterium]|nr:DUF2971 domain-containing protein [Hyphomicrobium sp.]NOU04783.1 DUF2971 domain-containing protein [Hyphomicrobiaceae bacterium]